ncbi:MAG: Single-stranded nucleic acid binding R3H domain-containing protein [Parcubacteria group bacterium GW2011_GWF2_39_13b]|nr:MAG: Single-stranded nucleic acid binding R3H domain-containing protein [Parcubacteria group bacterium GW2011_GWF2_39_13b]
MNDKLSAIKEIVEKLLSIMEFEAEVFIAEEDEGLVVNINCLEGGLLIGQGGESLSGLSHLIKLIAAKKLKDEFVSFSVDVNDYRRQRAEILKEFVAEKANRAALDNKNYALAPMTSYERRVVHMALQNRKDIICESEGEGAERHIVIKPA